MSSFELSSESVSAFTPEPARCSSAVTAANLGAPADVINDADRRQGASHEPPFAWTPREVREALALGNAGYASGVARPARISSEARLRLATDGQHPKAVVVTCSDSRVSAASCFSAGLGELFVVRAIGAHVGPVELASVEYGVAHLGCPLVVVLGHTHCGMVAAAIEGTADGLIGEVVAPLHEELAGETDPRAAELVAVRRSVRAIAADPVVGPLADAGKVEVCGAVYDIVSGEVRWL